MLVKVSLVANINFNYFNYEQLKAVNMSRLSRMSARTSKDVNVIATTDSVIS